MSRVLLTIRDEDYRGVQLVLRSDRGLSAVLAALKGAVIVERDRSGVHNEDRHILIGKEIEAEVKQVGKQVKFRVRDGEVDVECDAELKPARAKLPGRKTLGLAGKGNQSELLLGNGGR